MTKEELTKRDDRKKKMITQADTKVVMRSQINLADYNPRKISESARKALKANLKRVGLLGGIVWNEQTSNLVSGHQKISIIDEVNKYVPGNPDTDYPVRVEVVVLDGKSEKEQNIFMNNVEVQGEYDNDKLRKLINEIDPINAGLDDFQVTLLTDDTLGVIGTEEFDDFSEGEKWKKDETIEDNEELKSIDNKTKSSEESKKIDRKTNFYDDAPENQIARHNEVQKIKDRINNTNDLNKDGGSLSYLVVSFPNPASKTDFLRELNLPPQTKCVNIESLRNRIDIIDLDDDCEDII